MAKQSRQERAYSAIDTAWQGGKHRRGYCGYSKRGARKRMTQYEALFQRLLRVARVYGIRVFLMSTEEQERKHTDKQGNAFLAGGFFCAPAKITLRCRDARTLAHELGHALDYQLGGGYRGSEVVATAIEALVCGVALGSYSVNVDYATRQGGTSAHLEQERDRIDLVFEAIMEIAYPKGGSS